MRLQTSPPIALLSLVVCGEGGGGDAVCLLLSCLEDDEREEYEEAEEAAEYDDGNSDRGFAPVNRRRSGASTSGKRSRKVMRLGFLRARFIAAAAAVVAVPLFPFRARPTDDDDDDEDMDGVKHDRRLLASPVDSRWPRDAFASPFCCCCCCCCCCWRVFAWSR